MVSKDQPPADGPETPGRRFEDRATGRKALDAVVVPLVLGAVTGASVHLPALYWTLSVLAAVAAVAVGLEHRSWRSATLRGLVAGLFFGVGIVIVYLWIRDGVDVRVSPAPSASTPLVTAVAGAILTGVGALVLGRRTAH